MLWTIAIEFTKYALLAWFSLVFAFVGWLYFRTNDIKYALSVLAREVNGHYKGLPEWHALISKAIHFARLSAATGAGVLLLLQIVQLALLGRTQPIPISNKSNPVKKTEIAEFYARLRDANPAPTTELDYTTPFQLLIAVILSAQATDVGVNKATARLFPLAPTPEAILALSVDGLTEYIKTIGLFRTKAKNVIATCRMLVELHGGEVPEDRAALEALPGVGRKTANVVLNTAFGQPTIAVDTHIFRVGNRTGLAPGKTPLVVEQKLLRATPAEFARDAHHWLILHGRYVCKARKPECVRCVVADLCRFTGKTA